MGRRLAPWLVLLAIAGCGGADEAAEPERTFRNPVHDANFPDPFLLRAGDAWYAYGTNDEDGNVQTLVSRDLVTWRQGPDALPELGPWAYPGKTWAPEVLAHEGGYVLFYTANAAEHGVQCVGRATADAPAGPFVDRGREPFLCRPDAGGSIDPSPFRDGDGSLYLLWKDDGNAIGADTWILAQRLSPDTARLVGEPVRLVRQDAGWEGAVVEAPTLWRHDDRYVLFFSANAFDGDLYAVGYATCASPLGPCEDAPENPILASACAASGPGHQALVEDADGETWLAYHAWPAESGEDARTLWLDRLTWEDGKPRVAGPTCRPQPAP